MQEQRFCLQANMHGNAGEQLSATLTTEQQSNTFQRLDNCEAQPRAALEQPLLTNLHQQYLVSVGDDLEQQQDMNEELHGATGVQELQYNAPRLEISPVAPQLGEESLLQQTDSATGVEALYCPGCQEIAILEEEDPQTELQGKLSSLHLGEHKAYLKRKAYSFNRERGAFQSFPSHDVRLPISDIRYPEHLATEESPRRRARSLPWNSIPEVEEEEDSLLCCCKLKKRVQFADSLGLTLTSVKHFLPSDEPQVPPAVLARLQSFPPTVSAQRTEQLLQDELISADLAPSSSTPVELLERLNEQGMCLEKVSSSSFGVRGYVLVKDPGENAQVKIRYTFNEWLSFLDCPATLVGQSAALPVASECQRFHFNLCYPPATSCIHFAICSNTGQGQERWDNNMGANYTVNCQQGVTPGVQPPSPEQEEWWSSSQMW